VPNSHPIAANAIPESQSELPFITGHPLEKCFAQVAVRFHFGSFYLLQLMKRFMLAADILTLTKLKEGVFPFLFVLVRWAQLNKDFQYWILH